MLLFIEISQVDREYANIFYDVTNPVNLEKLSEDIRGIYISYAKFLCANIKLLMIYMNNIIFLI
jgi:hypothetical protein